MSNNIFMIRMIKEKIKEAGTKNSNKYYKWLQNMKKATITPPLLTKTKTTEQTQSRTDIDGF